MVHVNLREEKSPVKPEEIIFYIDLITDSLKKSTLTEGIKEFIEKKKVFNALSSYGVVIFQTEDNPINIYDKNDADSIIKIIEDGWNSREKSHSYLENGLFEILAYIFAKSREISKIYRVIIISDTPSVRSEDYYNAAYDLIIKAKKFHTYIDVIRIGDEDFYEDNIKLKTITSETQGGLFFCQDAQFGDIISSLVKGKQEFNIILGVEEGSEIFDEDKIFYEKLAVDLISLDSGEEEICDMCQQDVCPICDMYSDEIHKCYNCSAKFHQCCASKYAISNNIGFKHIFRCPQCETLLKLDDEYVQEIYEEELTEKIEELDPEKLRVKIKEKSSVDVQEQKLESTTTITKKIKTGFFSREIEIKTSGTVPDPNSEIIVNQSTEPVKPVESSTLSITSLRPPKKKRTLTLCKICGNTVRGKLTCPTCGSIVD